MAMLAALLGATSALGGLWLAFVLDTPTGPSIVCVAAVLFVLTSVISTLRG
jgi:zinc transport system permease protein